MRVGGAGKMWEWGKFEIGGCKGESLDSEDNLCGE